LSDVKEFEDGKSIQGLHYARYLEEFQKKGELDSYYGEIHAPLRTIYKSEIHKSYPIDKILEAMEYYEKNSSKGKVLIKAN